MELEALGDLALHIILTKVGPEYAGRVACVSKRLLLSASDESLWSKFCSSELSLSSPIDPLGNPQSSFKEAYKKWRAAFCMYPWELVKRVKKCWDTLEDWLLKNFPEAKATLRRGASEAEIQHLEESLKVKLPLPTKLLYRFHDGQEIETIDAIGKFGGVLGLIGGYAFYGHRVNVYLLSLNQIIKSTRQVAAHMGFGIRSHFIVLAASYSSGKKVFFLNCRNGQLNVGTGNLPVDGEMMPCVPNELVKSVHELNSDHGQDGVLLWLEEHGRRLQSGIINLRRAEDQRSISQFPEEPPLCSTAITHGVKVRGSAVFVPEFASLSDDEEKYLLAYSIRMSLLPEGCFVNNTCFSSCQLQRRNWIIRANDDVVDNIEGEAVIGKYPLLHAGGEEFVYESCSRQGCSGGSIEGSFTFIPGSLVEPKGGPFRVEVARIPLELPEYIF